MYQRESRTPELAGHFFVFFVERYILFSSPPPPAKNYAKYVKRNLVYNDASLTPLVIIIGMYIVSAHFDITVPFLYLSPQMKIRFAALALSPYFSMTFCILY